MRAYPSAAPVATPSNRQGTGRMLCTRSRAATNSISEVPGLAKHISTPLATRLRTRDSAPVMASLGMGDPRVGRPFWHCGAPPRCAPGLGCTIFRVDDVTRQTAGLHRISPEDDVAVA